MKVLIQDDITKVQESNTTQRQYRLVGIMMFCMACGLLIARCLSSLLQPYLEDLALEIIFSLLMQVGFLLLMPILFYIFAFKFKAKDIFKMVSIRKTKPVNYLLAVLIGIMCVFVTLFISSFWQMILAAFGYNGGSAAQSDESFNAGYFILMIFLTAVLPGICEEFTMRGGFLTVMRKSFGYFATLIIMAVSFGLFHQKITQVFYTSFFGLLMAMLTLKCGSIFVAMIVHFVNNAVATYLDFASQYGWFGGNYADAFISLMRDNPAVLMMIFVLCSAVIAGLILLFWKLNGGFMFNRTAKNQGGVYGTSKPSNPGDPYSAETPPQSCEGKAAPSEEEVFGPLDKTFKPKLEDNAFYIGAIVTTVLTTIFTFIFGWVI